MQMEIDVECKATETPQNIDIDRLKQRYAVERNKRITPLGEDQYIEVSDDFSDFYEVDPYTPMAERDAVDADIEVAILGGGFAGLLCAAKLVEQGVNDFRLIDMAGDFGGTWYWNRYPGVQCDIESYCYIPLLEELNYMPREKYSSGQEIFEHCQRIGRHFKLYERALFHTIVRSLVWDDDHQRWHITTDRGDSIRARYLIMATGPYNRPKLPGIKGIQRFRGHSFHSSRWDYDYTGGDATGGLIGLQDKKVALIGTGATGIQLVPFLARWAKHTYVFQRTPSSVSERGNRPTDPAWVSQLEPGWQKRRQRNLYMGTFERFYEGMTDLVCDGWTEINRNLAAKLAAQGNPQLSDAEYQQLRERVNFEVMERLRNRIDEIVEDKEKAEMLKPWYQFLCKRPTFNDDYLPAFNNDNVTLVDVSATQGVEEITEHGLVANGCEYQVDCIIYASGFEITTEIKRRFGIDVILGRKKVSLYDYWRDGFKTLYGQMTHGFPNQFFTGFLQGGVSVNVSAMYEQQAENIAYIIGECTRKNAKSVEPSLEAQNNWVNTMRELSVSNEEFLRACTPGYYNNEGGKVLRSHLGEQYGKGFYAFDDLLAEWRKEGNLEGLIITQ